MKRLSLVALAVVVALTGAGCNWGTQTSDVKPIVPKKISKKLIDEAQCEKRNKKKVCTKWDDKDWIFVTSDGVGYDVDEKEYNAYKVGDYWP